MIRAEKPMLARPSCGAALGRYPLVLRFAQKSTAHVLHMCMRCIHLYRQQHATHPTMATKTIDEQRHTKTR